MNISPSRFFDFRLLKKLFVLIMLSAGLSIALLSSPGSNGCLNDLL